MSVFNMHYVSKCMRISAVRCLLYLECPKQRCIHHYPFSVCGVNFNFVSWNEKKHHFERLSYIHKINREFSTHKNISVPISDVSEGVQEHVLAKVMYNSILSINASLSWNKKIQLKKNEVRKEQERRRNSSDFPFSLKYLKEDVMNTEMSKEEDKTLVLPFSRISCSDYNVTLEEPLTFYSSRNIDFNSNYSEIINETRNWMENYEVYDGEDLSNNLGNGSQVELNYGTPDRSIPISEVPCGGCGAYLQCQDTGVPGYLPSQLFRNCSIQELRALRCQRCHFLEKYNIALNLNVAPEDYTRLLSRIEKEIALALVLVDIMDFPCSLWPNIIDIIGTKRPVIVVGNKIDLLPRDSPRFLEYAYSWFVNALKESPLVKANVKDVSLISAYTGFGVESLITKLQNTWKNKGDVYLLGCTNVGKSTLFNALLQSDYCKIQATDIVQRATTSLWPGTTLSMLKFPILRPEGHRLYQRTMRLQELQREKHEEEKLLVQNLKRKKNPREATFMGHIGITSKDMTKVSQTLDPFSVRQTDSGGRVQLLGLDPNRKEFVKSKWCFDTPGTIHPDQILDILTAQELVNILPRQMILPRTFQLRVGDTLLIAGLGRVDLQGGVDKCLFTVFAADSLPITICRTVDSETIYTSLASADLLKVPSSEPERLAQWPGLSPQSDAIEITGCKGESAADLVLSSAGWISVTPREGETCILKAWTPFAKGIHLRCPPLMRFSVRLRGNSIRKTPAYGIGRAVKV